MYDSFILAKDTMLLIAYNHSRVCNHCINIDGSTNTILDSADTNPLPFLFVTCEDFKRILTSHFNISHIDDMVVFGVYELTPDTEKQYTK